MRKRKLTTVKAMVLMAGAWSGCGNPNSISQQTQGVSSHPPRLFLTPTVLQRLQARAAANDPAWLALQTQCEGYANGTFYPPSGNSEPNYPSVGQGYEGSDYLPAIMALGLCYRVVEGINTTAQAAFGATGTRLLNAIATPAASGGQPPSTDDGYGIRYYGTSMA